MATPRIRTLNFLPEIFQTPTNAQFLGATLDVLVDQPNTKKIEGYIGSKFGYGINAKDYYVTEPTKTRTDYQLEPGVVITKANETTAQDFISYPGIIDSLKVEGGSTKNNSSLFESEFYSWDSFSNLDKLINFNQYYWLPTGPERVTVATDVVFNNNDYIITSNPGTYSFSTVTGANLGINPTITLLRGGTYSFTVNQDSQFWIQGQPGITGFSPSQPNLQTRDVYGVSNNGASVGTVTFQVPFKTDQDEYNLPGNNLVGVVSTIPFSQINGQPVNTFAGIDGVTSLEGLRVLFYNTGVPNEVAYTSAYYGEVNYDTNNNSIVSPESITVTGTNTDGVNSWCITADTSVLTLNQTITFGSPALSSLVPGQVYFVSNIIDSTRFSVSITLGGVQVGLSNTTGLMPAYINQGLWEEGYYSNVDDNFYKVEYIGDPSSPVIRLVPDGSIPTSQKITANFGTQYVNRSFFKNTLGVINLIPYISAPLDTLYYQDGVTPGKVGVIRLIDNNVTNTLDVETEILGKKNFTAPNGVVFTNGLKVAFQGDIIPASYKTGEYYVEGVGTAIELINVNDLIVPEPFTESTYIPWDTVPWDMASWDGDSFIPVLQDYITIARNSVNKNAWSRSNRWFHIDVIKASALYNNNPDLLTLYATPNSKAKRPIIEFYPNLKLFNSGSFGKKPVDFIDFRTTDAFSLVAGQENYYPDVAVYTGYNSTIASCTSATSTTITVPASGIVGSFEVGQFVADSTNLLPTNAQITNISSTTTTVTLTVSWIFAATIAGTTSAQLIATDTTVDNYAVFDGSRIVFAADSELNVRNKIYVTRFSTTTPGSNPIITLTEAEDGDVLYNDQLAVYRGYNYQGKDFWFNALNWIAGQQKTNVNQAPLFDVYDKNGISFGDATYYQGTSFKGSKLFSYAIGSGINDIVLGFPLKYSSVDNVGDIQFDVSLNTETFNFVDGTNPQTLNVNTGYVYNYIDRSNYVRELGWQTAVAPSVQYQLFSFDYVTGYTGPFICDIVPNTNTIWPNIQVYINNVLQSTNDYSVAIGAETTTVYLNNNPIVDTVIEVLILSDQVSSNAYYTIPINLNNNPLNQNLTTVNVGDIRGQYQSSFYNNPNTTGEVFGPNNYRDLGNMVPWGNRIIQNSASLVLPGALLRKQNLNLFNSLIFNNREYIKFKTVLIDTVQTTVYQQTFDPSVMLDSALDVITSSKSNDQPFFWSDMLPSKSPYIVNSYSFANSLDVSVYPLSQIYNLETANYNGVLVYLTRTTLGVTVNTQLVINQDYTISATAPSLTVTKDLLPGDVITIKEYNQTYGSYCPNTPTKLGLYPAFVPQVILDVNYFNPTYFILGHDGSYTKLYGDYDPNTGILVDFRDQVLLEFEKRIYNNLKLSSAIPIQEYEVLPGYFRSAPSEWEDFLQVYRTTFLDWVGTNRVEYKTQFYNKNDSFSFNYRNSGNKLDQAPILQGYWRGVYQYFYDTTTPNTTPWQMLGYKNQPDWWETRYGPAPYTRDNLVLWSDLEAGISWNNGNPIIIEQAIRPGLLEIIPVDSNGDLLAPFDAVMGNYVGTTFRNDWIVGDMSPTELSYRRSSSWPFDLMRIMALTKPAKFYNLAVDLDDYKYNTEFNQYLVNDRNHLIINDIQVYGNGTAKTSYLNWIVDYEKQYGINATLTINELFKNLDVRLVYRLAGFSDKTLLKFYVEKGTPNSRNASLLIPDESYQVLLYDNQPFDKIVYSGVIIQIVPNGYAVYGNAQTYAYFNAYPNKPVTGKKLTVENLSAQIPNEFYNNLQVVPYGTIFYTVQDVVNFIMGYGAYLEASGMVFNTIENGIEINWEQMAAEFLYWAQTGWEVGSIVTLNPAAKNLKIDKDSYVVQPLTIQKSNFILNENLYPIQLKDLSITRDGTLFDVKSLNQGDSMGYGQFFIQNFEHGIVFSNTTLFGDIIYNLVTGLRQNRITLRGTKTADWNGTVTTAGFIYNQDNIREWSREVKYTKGQIVKYKNKYWTALTIVQAKEIFDERDWKQTEYDQIQKGLLPNPSTRSYESTLYYNIDKANLENDADLLSFSLIGYRPRDYLALADLTDITQVNVYKNMIKNKGTLNAASAFKGANLPQGGIDYEIYENWAIKSGEFGGLLNSNFVEFKLNQNYLTGNPGIVGLTNGTFIDGVQQEVPIYSLFNYARPITDPDILPTIPASTPNYVYPDAGYVNFNDVKLSSFYYSQLPVGVNNKNTIVPINEVYVRDYIWLANYLGTWQVFTPKSISQVVFARNNLNNTVTLTFANPHNLKQYSPFMVVNFDTRVNGYYIVSLVVDPYNVIISLNLDISIKTITGNGIGLAMQSQRIAQPSDIVNLPLLDSEFTKNKVWVDTNSDGSWAVYRKSINYLQENIIYNSGSLSFGSSVAFTSDLGYLIADADKGEVYRYIFNDLTKQYELLQTITEGTSFGSSIAYAENIFVVSEPDSNTVYVYQLQQNNLTNQLIEIQSITNVVDAVSISKDGKWIYVSDLANNTIFVYRQQFIPTPAGSFSIGQTYVITEIGTTDFTLIGATSNNVGIAFIATGVGSGTGSATNSTYALSTSIDGDLLGLTVAGDDFGYSTSTDYYGDTLVIGTPNKNSPSGLENWGYTYIFNRLSQNIEVQSSVYPQQFPLVWTPPQGAARTASAVSSDFITCNLSMTSFNVDDPVIFQGSNFGNTGIKSNTVYYIAGIVGSTISIKTSRFGSTLTLVNDTGLSFNVYVQTTPIYVYRNGSLVTDNNYAIVGSNIVYTTSIDAGDIINVSGQEFVQTQTLTNGQTPKIGVQYGHSVDSTKFATEIIVGAPFDLNDLNEEGAVYRYTNVGGKYGSVTGTTACNVTTARTLLLNGYSVTIPIGNVLSAAAAINSANITNVEAAYDTVTAGDFIVGQTYIITALSIGNGSVTDFTLIGAGANVIGTSFIATGSGTGSGTATTGLLTIALKETDLAQSNQKLVIVATNINAYAELGFNVYAQTQIVNCPHVTGPTQFGYTVKFNEFGSFVASAPTGTRFEATTFDFSDDELDNDTVFDNNSTQFIDTAPNAGAVYMFDYLSNYNENINNVGLYVYAQSVNDITQNYGSQPYYGTTLDFNNNHVVVGTPNFIPGTYNGQVITFNNLIGTQDWSVFRDSAPVVDINRLNNSQIFSAETNNTLINLDYIDPLQGKILGAARENIDVVANDDPARYNNAGNTETSTVWGADHLGQLWLNTSAMRYVNYHQNDVVYNSRYWATLFPNSDVAVYSWIASPELPSNYTGTGTPFDITRYTIQYELSSTGAITPMYYYWVRNTNIVFTKFGKTLSDTVVELYIRNPQGSGISYYAPMLPSVIGLYNCQQYINANDSVLHISYATGYDDAVSHNQFTLIRANYKDDFLPGLPASVNNPLSTSYGNVDILNGGTPYSLYAKLLDSLSGVNIEGGIVPDPYLPRTVQSGILSRPRQTFFLNRFKALENYFGFANSILKQFPIAEIREFQLMFKKGIINPSTIDNPDWTSGPKYFYDTTDYWSYINWWADGYSDNTKSSIQVPLYADLSTLNVSIGTIVTVLANSNSASETYILSNNNVWERIGLQNGTIKISENLWNYADAKIGFGDNFFDTDPFDTYPSEPTRNIVRSLNESIFIDELLIYRNKGLILLFEYTQSETIENQNYLPWLNKTSFIDVSHTIRELKPYEVFQSDNQDFLAGYLNEIKPYHVVIKEFLFTYKGTDVFEGDITDFDLPAQYNADNKLFISPELVYQNPSSAYQYPVGSPIWQNINYNQWFNNYGLKFSGQDNYPITLLASSIGPVTTSFVVENASGFPVNGVLKLASYLNDQVIVEEIGYNNVDTYTNVVSGLTRGVNGTPVSSHVPGQLIYIDLPAILVENSGRDYINPPKVTAYVNPYSTENCSFIGSITGTTLTVDSVLTGEIVLGNYIYNENVLAETQIISENSDGTYEVNFNQNLTTQNFIQYVGPKRQAVLEAVMGFDKVLSINVIDSGEGYVTQPQIVVDPALTITFDSADVDLVTNTIRLYAPTLQDGDLIQYKVGASTTVIGGLINNQWYYVGLLETSPLVVIALYATYNDAIVDTHRIEFYNAGTGSNQTINMGARAQCVLNSQPIRENITTLRYDRTTYNSDVIDWEAGRYYGAFYAGQYYSNNILLEPVSVSSINNETFITNAISNINGVPFEISDVSNERVVEYNSVERIVAETIAGNYIRLNIGAGIYNPTASASTIGFTLGMPIKFKGAVGTTGITENQVYYVSEIANEKDFKISTSETNLSGTVVTLTPQVIGAAGLVGYPGKVSDTAIVSVYYPGIRTVTQTFANTNYLKIPLHPTGTGGTNGLQKGMPVIFTSSEDGAVFGNIVENDLYYITTICDEEQFTISRTDNPLTLSLVSCSSINDTVTVSTNTDNLQINDPIIFTDFVFNANQIISGQVYTITELGTTDFTAIGAPFNTVGTKFTASGAGTGSGKVSSLFFSNIQAGVTYYISALVTVSSFKISTGINLGDVTIAGNVSGSGNITSQVEAYKLASVTGNMIANINLPVSPGQVDGQKFTFYQTANNPVVYNNVPFTVEAASLLNRITDATIAGSNIILVNAESGGLDNFYVNLPIRFNTVVGSLSTGTTYYVVNTGVVTVNCTNTSTLVKGSVTGSITGDVLTVTAIGSGFVAIGAEITGTGVSPNTEILSQLTGTPGGIGTYQLNTTYASPVSSTTITVFTGYITCNSTASLAINMPIVFSGVGLGGILINDTYYVSSIINSTDFTISTSVNGNEFVLQVDNGTMNGTGDQYIQISNTLGGSVISPGNSQVTCTITSGSYPGDATVTIGSGLFTPEDGRKVYFKTTGKLPDELTENEVYYVVNSTGPTTSGGTLKVSEYLGGSPIQISGAGTGTIKMLFADDITFTQYITANPVINVSYVLGEYTSNIDGSSQGQGFALTNQIKVLGTNLGGTTANNLIITVTGINELTVDPITGDLISSDGKITNVTNSGLTPSVTNEYYLKVISNNQFKVYQNSLMTIPVSGLTFPYDGVLSTTVTALTTTTLSVSSTTGFYVNDPIVFTGNVQGNITLGQVYYIKTLSPSFTISETINGTAFAPAGSTLSTNFTMAKSGDFALLPEPFYFDPSVVKFNKQAYLCLVSNNDTEFIIGKWQLLDSGNRLLNALDRVKIYYEPTDNMPGIDLPQLFTGLQYPNSTYFGNKFAPDEQFAIDTILPSTVFTTTGINLTAITYDGDYIATFNNTTKSGVAKSIVGANPWTLEPLAKSVINVTDIIFANGKYVVTTDNAAVPVYYSNDSVSWTNTVTISPIGSTDYLNSITYNGTFYVAAGNNIIISNNLSSWQQVYSFSGPLTNQLNGVGAINISGFNGVVAVGKGQRYDYSGPLTQTVNTNIILSSSNLYNWQQINPYSFFGFNTVAHNGTIAVIAGENGIIYISSNGVVWNGITEIQVFSTDAVTNSVVVLNVSYLNVGDKLQLSGNNFGGLVSGTDYYVASINVSNNSITLCSDVSLTIPVTVTTASPIGLTTVYMPGANINKLYYDDFNNIFVAVGDRLDPMNPLSEGTILTSSNGIVWTAQTSNVTEDLYGIASDGLGNLVAVGNNNIVIESNDAGVTWTLRNTFIIPPEEYIIKGDSFTAGYGPEELVPGVVTDNLYMTVTTRPGTTWEATRYAHVGYNVHSTEIAPLVGTQTIFNFRNLVPTPSSIFVAIMNSTNELSTTIYENIDYTVDWVNLNVILNNQLAFGEKLRIDVYEAGNGDQLVKSNTFNDPIRYDVETGWNEIYLDCNYNAPIDEGSGVCQIGTGLKYATIIATDGDSNTIVCEDVSNFTLNDPITIQGATFGNLTEDTIYYVKTISYVTNRITVSTTVNFVTGIAGPTFILTTATGTCVAIINVGNGTPYTDPLVYHNGTKLVHGLTGIVTRTKSGTNTIQVNSTAGFSPLTPISFSDTMFGGLSPHTTYYIKSVLSEVPPYGPNEFTISLVPNGPDIILTDDTGIANFITNDYAFGLQPDAVRAKIIFTNPYDVATDYLAFTVFGQTSPVQYGYTIPESQLFTGDNVTTIFNLDNFISDDSKYNAIVEINGLRINASDYTINNSLNIISFSTAPAAGDTISVTMYNDTERQYLNTQFGITASPGSTTASFVIGSTTNENYSYDALVYANQLVIGQLYTIVTVGTTNFVALGAASNTIGVSFTATGYGSGTGTVTIAYDESNFGLENTSYLTMSSGTTALLNVNDKVVFSTPTLGGIVADTPYYVTSIINSTDFTVSLTVGGTNVNLYNDSGSMASAANALNVADIVAINNSITPYLATTNVTATTSGTNEIACASTAGFVSGQTIQFKGTAFGGISSSGTVYVIDTINNITNTFTILDSNGNPVTLSTATGIMVAFVGGNPAIRVTTGTTHKFLTNSLVRIDGTTGSVQLNNKVFYVHVINSTQFDLYEYFPSNPSQQYDPALTAINYPVVVCNSYTGGGYTWLDGLFVLSNVVATDTTAITNIITLKSGYDTGNLVVNTPIYFTESSKQVGDVTLGGLVIGDRYYIKEIVSINEITVSSTYQGNEVVLTTASGAMNCTQWEQDDVDRLWVTVNGERVPSSKLKLNPGNFLSILTIVVPGDIVTITSMMPSATPNQESYLLNVNKNEEALVYRANNKTRTWLTSSISFSSNIIYVNELGKITDTIEQSATAPASVNGYKNIGLNADKNSIASVTVYNLTTTSYISSSNYSIVLESLSPTLKIADGAYITTGDSILITIIEGNNIYLNGEQIRFTVLNPVINAGYFVIGKTYVIDTIGTTDFTAIGAASNTLGLSFIATGAGTGTGKAKVQNAISGLIRGVNGTPVQEVTPIYSEVYSLLPANQLDQNDYILTWNPIPGIYNPVLGDPLQIAETQAANFLKQDD